MLKKIILGAAAAKTYNATKRPTLTTPPGITIVGLEHIGIGNKWRVTYLRDDNKNVTRSFTIHPSVKTMNMGGKVIKIFWP